MLAQIGTEIHAPDVAVGVVGAEEVVGGSNDDDARVRRFVSVPASSTRRITISRGLGLSTITHSTRNYITWERARA